MSYTPLQLDKARRADMALAGQRANYQRFGKSGRMTRQLSLTAYMNGMSHIGTDATPEAKEQYFRDNERLYFGINADMTPPGLRNRHGRVKERIIFRTGKDGKVFRIVQQR